jgi:hypothetical protein
VDLLSKLDLDEVFVLAPLASYTMDRPRNPATKAERIVRQWATAELRRDIARWKQRGACRAAPGGRLSWGSTSWTGRGASVLEICYQPSAAALAAIP